MSGDPKDGGWAPCRPAAWLRAAEFLPRPLSEDEAQTDLWVLNDVARQKGEAIPGYRALAARWGWSERPTRALVAGTPKLCLSSRGARRNGVAFLPQSRRIPAAIASHSEPANVDNGENPSRSRRIPAAMASHSCRNGVAPLLDDVVSSDAFEGPQKQTTEAEDRLQTETEEHVPQGPLLAAPPALGPADPTTDEPDWDALFTAVPLTYGEDDEAAEDEGPVGSPAGGPSVATVVAPLGDAGDVDSPSSAVSALQGPSGGGPARPGSLLTLEAPEASATHPPPATRKRKGARPAPVGDVETLWEAWRAHGTVRGEPNAFRRKAMERVLRDYPLADLLEMLDAAHNGDGDKWRWLQGATSRSNAVYLRPETLLRPSTIAGRMDDARDWVEAGRPRHDVAETRVEVRAEVAAKSLAQRAKDAWTNVIIPNQGANDERFAAVLAAFGTSPRADEARAAILGGLTATRGLRAVGAADKYSKPALREAFVRGFAAALGGTVTEAELREVG